MPVQQLKDFLEREQVKFVTIKHSLAFTALEIAESAHVRGRDLAKTVVVEIDGDMAMVVLPASRRLSLERLRAATGAKTVELATEASFEARFPSCEVGAMPPFGNLWDMRVFVDQHLREDEQIAFNAGTHTELVRLSYGDFERLTEPVVLQVAESD